MLGRLYELSLSGRNDERKMKLVAIEYRARLLLERFKKMGRIDGMDPTTKAPIETIGTAGYVVSIEADRDKNMIVETVNQSTSEVFVVRAAELYPAAVELAVQVGIELEDG